MKLTRLQLRSLINEVAQGGLPSQIRIGETYTDPEGNKVTVTNIVLYTTFASMNRVPLVQVEYDYETVDGKTGHESNGAVTFIEILMGKR